MLDRVEHNVTILHQAVQRAADNRAIAQPNPVTANEWLLESIDALGCEWVEEAHAAIEAKVCGEVTESWALLAMLLPFAAFALLLDAIHARGLVGVPPMLCPPLPKWCKRKPKAIVPGVVKVSKAEAAKQEAEAKAQEAAEQKAAEEKAAAEVAQQEKLARQWERSEKRAAAPPAAPAGFAAAFMNSRLQAAEKAKCLGAAGGAAPKRKQAWAADPGADLSAAVSFD